MDDLISIFRKSIKELGACPVLLMAGLAVGVLALPGLAENGHFDEAVKAIAIDFSQLLLPLLIMPFFTGGALGYALEVRSKGSSSLSTFIGSGKKNYAKLLMAGVISFAAFYLLTIGVLVFLAGGLVLNPLFGLLLGFVMLALTLLILLAIEFYDIGIVANGLDVIASFRNSIDFVKHNLASAAAFFLVVLLFKALVMVPASFGMAGAMMSNETYYNTLMNASLNVTPINSTAYNSTTLNSTDLNSTALNSTYFNIAPLLAMTTPPPMGNGLLLTIGVFQILIQGFAFALLTLFKTEFYMAIRQRKRITDFDYDFSDEKGSPPG